ncbi:hypothetical protein DFH29DRAFT_809071, partial [Suillus ampliporus]
LAGVPQDDLAASFSAGDYSRTFIVTPARRSGLRSAIANCMELDKPFFPHLKLVHISASLMDFV